MKVLAVVALLVILLLAFAAPAMALGRGGSAPGELIALEKLMARPQFDPRLPEAPTAIGSFVPVNAVQLNPQPEVPSSSNLFDVPPSPVWPH